MNLRRVERISNFMVAINTPMQNRDQFQSEECYRSRIQPQALLWCTTSYSTWFLFINLGEQVFASILLQPIALDPFVPGVAENVFEMCRVPELSSRLPVRACRQPFDFCKKNLPWLSPSAQHKPPALALPMYLSRFLSAFPARTLSLRSFSTMANQGTVKFFSDKGDKCGLCPASIPLTTPFFLHLFSSRFP